MIAAVLSFPCLAGAQFQMPDAKTMSGIPRPDDTVATGSVIVRLLRGQLSNNITRHPVELEIAGKSPVSANTDETGRAEFKTLPVGARVKAVAIVGGERLESQEFPIPAQGGVRVMLVATDKAAAAPEAPRDPIEGIVVLGDQTRFVVEFQEDALQVFYLLDIVNSARAPVRTAGPLIFDMPPGATGTTVLEGSSPQAVARGTRVAVTGPFASGVTKVQIAYRIEPSSGDVTIRQPLPAAVQELAVIVQKAGDLRLSSKQITTAQEVQAESGVFIMGTGPAIRAGDPLELALSGVPHHSRAPRYTVLAVAMAVLVMGLWAGFSGAPHVRGPRAQELEARREKLLNDLVRLERQHRAGAVDQPRYGTRRRELVRQLERIYGELDSNEASP